MATDIHERVKVMAVFDGELMPVKFRWRGELYLVKEVTYTWRSMDGSAGVVHFAVTDGATLFELAYNQATMRWSLESVEV